MPTLPGGPARKDRQVSAQGRAPTRPSLGHPQSCSDRFEVACDQSPPSSPSTPFFNLFLTAHSDTWHMITPLPAQIQNQQTCFQIPSLPCSTYVALAKHSTSTVSPACTCPVCTHHSDRSPAHWHESKNLIHTSFIKLTSHVAHAQGHFLVVGTMLAHPICNPSLSNHQRNYKSHRFYWLKNPQICQGRETLSRGIPSDWPTGISMRYVLDL